MKALALAVALVAISSGVAAAAILHLPSTGKPSATLTVPDNWSRKVSDDGIEITSPDEDIYVLVATLPQVVTEEEFIKEMKDVLGKEEMTVDRNTVMSHTGQINGMNATFTSFNASQQGTTVRGFVTQAVTPTPEVVAFVLVAATVESREKHRAELDAINNSLKPVN